MLDFLMRHWLLSGLAASSLIGLLMELLKTRSGLKTLSTQEAVQLMNEKEVFILDVRSEKETAINQKRSLKNAAHIPLVKIVTHSELLKKHTNKPVLVVCSKGDRAHSAWSMLKAIGFNELYTLSGGLHAWQEQGLPTSSLNLSPLNKD